MARAFDHFMVATRIGRTRKLRRNFTVPERWCYVAGVLAIAAEAPIRGRLLIEGERADENDVAERADVSLKVARSTLSRMRELEMLVPDEELNCERVHDFEEHNPEPKRDATAAERMRRYRDRLRRNGGSNVADVTDDATEALRLARTEGKGREEEEEDPQTPVTAGSVGTVFEAWVEAAWSGKGSRPKLTNDRRRLIQRRLKDYPAEDLTDAVRGWRHSPHHRGENDRQTVYNSLELLLRDAKHVELFRDLEREHGSKLALAVVPVQNAGQAGGAPCRNNCGEPAAPNSGGFCEQCVERVVA